MKKLFVAFVACAMLVGCGNKPATEEQTEETVVEEAVVEEAVVEEAVEAAPAEEVVAPVENEKATLIDLYVKACEEENEIEATRVAKRIDAEYKDQLTSEDIERMTAASAVLAEKRAAQTKEAAETVGNALKNLKKN